MNAIWYEKKLLILILIFIVLILSGKFEFPPPQTYLSQNIHRMFCSAESLKGGGSKTKARPTKTNLTSIQFASWGSQSEVEIIKPILAEFEKQNPDIKVEFTHIPQNYFQKIHLLFASNLAPDVIFINNLYFIL